MISFILILIGLTLFYALFTNKTGDLLAALLTGKSPKSSAPDSSVPPTTTLPNNPVTGV